MGEARTWRQPVQGGFPQTHHVSDSRAQEPVENDLGESAIRHGPREAGLASGSGFIL